MDGLIVKQPYARKLVNGSKKIEYRSTRLPSNKTNKEVYILTTSRSGRKILGTVMFTECIKIEGGFEWHAEFPIKFDAIYQYIPKNGAVIWINDVHIGKVVT